MTINPDQLELDLGGSPSVPNVVRNALPPAWAAVVLEELDEPESLVLTRCDIRGGRLWLDGMPAPGAAWTQQEADIALGEAMLVANRTCAACGEPGALYLRAPDGVPRTLCRRCPTALIVQTFAGLCGTHFDERGNRRAPGGGSPAAVGREPDPPMSADELRALYHDLYRGLTQTIVGQDEACAAFALAGALHVGGSLPLGPRLLLMGPSGVGKTTLCRTMARLMPGNLAFVYVDASDLTSPGWSSAPSIGDLVQAAIGRDEPDSCRARKAVVMVDEFAHLRVIPGTEGNLRAKREEVLTSLLTLAGGGPIQLGDSNTAWDSTEAMVVFSGAFTGLRMAGWAPTVRELTDFGIPPELANRIGQEVVVLRRLPEAALVDLLRRWPQLAALCEVAARLGYSVQILDETYRRAARVLALGHDGSTPRTAAGWLVGAVKSALVGALDGAVGPEAEAIPLVITPDCLPVEPTATKAASGAPRRRDDDDPDWDAALLVRLR